MFLVKEELKTVSTLPLIEQITAQDNSIIEAIIAESIALMQSYLAKYYDIQAIFAAQGADRHLTVLKRLKDIVIYEIYERHTREQNKVAGRRYDEAMAWLEKLNTGEFRDSSLPTPQAAALQPARPDTIRFGSNTRYTSNY